MHAALDCTSPKYKLVLDLMYIENYSIIKDIKLLLQTLVVLFKPDSTEAFDKQKKKILSGMDKDTNDWWEEG